MLKRVALVVVLPILAACATRPASNPGIEQVKKLLAKEPDNTVYLYVLATRYDGAKDVRSAVRTLEHLDRLKWDLGIEDSSFTHSASNSAFRRVAKKLEAREHESLRATVAFKLHKERKVRSEGITYDPVDDVFYFSGGTDKLLRVDRTGNIRELPVDPPGQKFGRLGMDVDAERRQIWVVNGVFDPEAPAEEKGKSAVSVYDLRDGRLIRRVRQGSAETPSFLNDMTLLKDGTAFVTDTGRSHVYRLAPGAETFELWAEDFRAPNGIAVSADERTLYVADFRGLTRFDLATKSRELLTTSTPLNGIDGLIEHGGALIGIQNVLGRPRIVRVHVSDANRVELLASKDPRLDSPATGVVAGNEYFFLANRNDLPEDRVILKIPL